MELTESEAEMVINWLGYANSNGYCGEQEECHLVMRIFKMFPKFQDEYDYVYEDAIEDIEYYQLHGEEE